MAPEMWRAPRLAPYSFAEHGYLALPTTIQDTVAPLGGPLRRIDRRKRMTRTSNGRTSNALLSYRPSPSNATRLPRALQRSRSKSRFEQAPSAVASGSASSFLRIPHRRTAGRLAEDVAKPALVDPPAKQKHFPSLTQEQRSSRAQSSVSCMRAQRSQRVGKDGKAKVGARLCLQEISSTT